MTKPSTQLFLEYMQHKSDIQRCYPNAKVWTFLEYCFYAYHTDDIQKITQHILVFRLSQLPNRSFVE